MKRLYRSETDRQIAGVCAGIADYFDVDPTLIRILFLVLFFAGGPGFLLYIILWIAVPEESTIYGEPVYKQKRKTDDYVDVA